MKLLYLPYRGRSGKFTQTYRLQASNDIHYTVLRKGFYRSDEHLYRVLDERSVYVCLQQYTIQRKHTEIGVCVCVCVYVCVCVCVCVCALRMYRRICTAYTPASGCVNQHEGMFMYSV